MHAFRHLPCDTDIHHAACDPGARFSILIPTWNNLEFVRLCVEGIRKNSSFPHQVVLHVNEGADGTAQWARGEKLSFTHSAVNLGVCHAVNIARTLAQTDYILYMNDDMYACPGWDRALWDEIQRLGHFRFMLSATMLEPHPTRSTPVIAPRDYGTTVATFDESRLLDEYPEPRKDDWSGATRPPTLVHKCIWDMVGGYSVELTPGSYSDPDFSMKLWQAGVRHFRGIGRSRVYHFTSKSIVRIKMNDGRRQFLRKWGITSSTLERHLLRLGLPFRGDLPDRPSGHAYRIALLKNRLQRFMATR